MDKTQPPNTVIHVGNIELCWDSRGVLDEIFLSNQGFHFHLERMDEHHVWLHVNDGQHGVHLHIGPSEDRPADIEWNEDAWNDSWEEIDYMI